MICPQNLAQYSQPWMKTQHSANIRILKKSHIFRQFNSHLCSVRTPALLPQCLTKLHIVKTLRKSSVKSVPDCASNTHHNDLPQNASGHSDQLPPSPGRPGSRLQHKLPLFVYSSYAFDVDMLWTRTGDKWRVHYPFVTRSTIREIAPASTVPTTHSAPFTWYFQFKDYVLLSIPLEY